MEKTKIEPTPTPTKGTPIKGVPSLAGSFTQFEMILLMTLAILTLCLYLFGPLIIMILTNTHHN